MSTEPSPPTIPAAESSTDEGSSCSNLPLLTKRRFVDASNSMGEVDDHANHYQHDLEVPSDLTVTIKKPGRKRYTFHLHRAVLALDSTWFACVIKAQDHAPNMVVELPQDFGWSTKRLVHFFQLCYRQYDDVLLLLASAPTIKAFGEMWYRVGAVTTLAGDAETRWTVVRHTAEGKSIIQTAGNDESEQVIGAGNCQMGDLTAFHEKLAGQTIDLLEQLQIAQYYHHDHLMQLLTVIMLKLVKIAHKTLLPSIAYVADSMQMSELRSACLDKMKSMQWNDKYKQQLLKLSVSFVIELLLPTAGPA